MSRAADRLWYGESAWAAAARAALAPAGALFGAVTSLRNALYDRGWLAVLPSALPAVSVGNLAVGGTGKTPVAAWMARELAVRGGRPAVVMRGYGGDEPLVHAALNPGIPVLVAADRAAGVRSAAASHRDVVVLDDAFQHRRAARLADVVLVSADRWVEPFRLLPAGPGREPVAALRRASLVLVTRKAAPPSRAAALARRLAGLTRTGEAGVMHLGLGAMVDWSTGTERELGAVRDARVLLASGVGDPGALLTQLRTAGLRVEAREFPDHHVYEAADIATLVSEGSRFDALVCTLKDAVKLGPAWPRGAGPLWYVSQRCEVEAGGAALSALLDRVLAARATANHQRPAPGRRAHRPIR